VKGYRFYEEFTNTRKRVSVGNVVALELDDAGNPFTHWDGSKYVMSAIVGGGNGPNTWPTSGAVSPEHLRKRCKRVSARRAREVHPAIFDWVDPEEPDERDDFRTFFLKPGSRVDVRAIWRFARVVVSQGDGDYVNVYSRDSETLARIERVLAPLLDPVEHQEAS
jgi:hypothetical protein